MENNSFQAYETTSSDNLFADDLDHLGNFGPINDEEFGISGAAFEALLEKEEKMYLSAGSIKSKADDKSNEMVSGITMGSSMIESGDSHLLHQKLTVSQYLAYRSEPLGKLESTVSGERPNFSLHQSNPLNNEEEKKSEKSASIVINPDFTEDPSWLNKHSLSSLSSSENAELFVKSQENSENWLLGKNKSLPQLRVTEHAEESKYQREAVLEDEKKHHSMKPAIDIPSVVCPPIGELEESDIPSLYWKPIEEKGENDSKLEEGHTKLEAVEQKYDSRCHSYVAGHIEMDFRNPPSKKLSDIPSSTRSVSPASTVRENSQFEENDSLLAEPQLSSTRELSDDGSQSFLSSKARSNVLTEKPVPPPLEAKYSLPAKIVNVNITNQSATNGKSLTRHAFSCPLESFSTSETKAKVTHSTRLSQDTGIQSNGNGSSKEPLQTTAPINIQNKTGDDRQESVNDLETEESVIKAMEMMEFARGLSPDSLVAIFSNTTSLSTPSLMKKVREHMLGISSSKSAMKSSSSGIGGSEFESQFSGIDSLLDGNMNRGPSQSNNSEITDRDRKYVCQKNSTPPVISDSSISINNVSTKSCKCPVSNCRCNIENQLSKTPPSKTTAVTSGRPLLSLPIHSTPSNNNAQLLPEVIKPRLSKLNSENDFSRVTATVMKKVSTESKNKPKESSSKSKVNLMEQCIAQAPVIKCNKSHVYFGGADYKAGQIQRQKIILRNTSFTQPLELELRIKDSEEFTIIRGNDDMVSRCILDFSPRDERTVELAFQPSSFGQFNTKLNLYPRGDAGKRIKYTVDLCGYGGSSQVQLLVPNSSAERVLIPKFNGQVWSCHFALENCGTVPAFAAIHCCKANGEPPVEPNQFIILPQCLILGVKEVKEIQILIHLPQESKLPPMKLNVVWGDETLRHRWIKCVATGTALKCPSHLEWMDFTRLLQLDVNHSIKFPVTEQDMTLFYEQLKIEEIAVVFNDIEDDSHFITLAMETATVCESMMTSSETMLSQRRLTTLNNAGHPYKDGCITLGVTELIFPSTKVGGVSTQKIPLQNWSPNVREIRVNHIEGPFVMRHLRSAVPGGYYTRLPIHFQPTKVGNHNGRIVLDVGSQNQLCVNLKGEAV